PARPAARQRGRAHGLQPGRAPLPGRAAGAPRAPDRVPRAARARPRPAPGSGRGRIPAGPVAALAACAAAALEAAPRRLILELSGDLAAPHRVPHGLAGDAARQVRQVGELADRVTAVDGETLTGDPGRLRSREEAHRPGDVLRLAGVLERLLGQE